MVASIPPPPADQIELGPLTIHFYGIFIAVGAFVAATMTRRRFEKRGGDGALADRVALWAIVAGVLGARAGYVVTHLDRFDGRPAAVFFVWEGGLAFFGGLFAGAAVAVWLLRRAGVDLATFADCVAPGIPLAQAIGRWGNYFNQELYGTPTDLPWALEVEPEHRVSGHASDPTFHPTFLYEMILNLFLAGLLLWLDRGKKLRRGALPFVYLIVYGAIRFGMELLRTDTTFRLLGISRNGWVSVLAMIAGIAGVIWRQRSAADESEADESEEEPIPSPS